MCWADKNEMKVLVIWKALVSEAYHKRFKKLSRFKDVELTVIVPTKWHNTILEKKYCEEYKIIPRKVVLNGHNHLHWYPGLEKLVKQIRPDIFHIEEEHCNLVTYQAIRLAKKGRQRVLNNFTQERVAGETYKVYQKIMCCTSSLNLGGE